MDDNKMKSLKGSWTIVAYDGKDSVVSSSGRFNIEFQVELTGINELQIPKEFSISQNYPNPFNPSTRIKFGLPKSCFVSISLHNMIGQFITTIFEGDLKAGYHETLFNASSYPSGIYFYTIKAGDFKKTMKMMLIK
jgi:hypothetical protein